MTIPMLPRSGHPPAHRPAPRTHVAMLVALATVLAGCTIALPEAHRPTRAPYPWEETTSDPWIMRLSGCLDCPGSPAQPAPAGTGAADHEAMLVFRDGTLLRLRLWVENRSEPITFTHPTPEAALVARAWKAMTGHEPQGLVVANVTAARLALKDADAALQVLTNAVAGVGEQRTSATCTGCTPAQWTALAPPRPLTRSMTPAPDGASPQGNDDAWTLIERQFALLEDWLDHPPAPSRPVA